MLAEGVGVKAASSRYSVSGLFSQVVFCTCSVSGGCHFFTKLVAMATPLEISEKEVQIDHLHPKRFHSVKRL